MSKKLTLKNIMVYDYMRRHLDSSDVEDSSVKSVFRANQEDIAKRFSITTYQAFNFHVRKCLDWENSTGNKVNVIRMDNKGVTDNENNT